MRIINVPSDEKNQLYLEIDRNLSSIVKRNVAYLLNTFSNELATIILFVNGKRGTSQKSIILQKKDGKWYAYEQNNVYELTSISEISSVCKTIINRLYIIVSKF